MAIIGYWIILFILAIVFACKVCLATIEIIAAISASIKKGWAKLWTKKKSEVPGTSLKNEPSTPVKYERDMALSSMPEVRVERFGWPGKCGICGKEFSPVASVWENHLNRVVYEFYGKRRDKKICSACLKLLSHDQNCRIISQED